MKFTPYVSLMVNNPVSEVKIGRVYSDISVNEPDSFDSICSQSNSISSNSSNNST